MRAKRLSEDASTVKVREACSKLDKAIQNFKDNVGTKADVQVKALELISSLCEESKLEV